MPKGSFRGGIHPQDHKELTAHLAIEEAKIPEKVRIPVHPNPRFATKPIVKKGDVVYVGQKIADNECESALPAHSPISGKVIAIDNIRIGSGTVVKAIEIASDGLMTLSDNIHPISDNVTKEEFISILREGGICGMGGAEFPTAIKFNTPEGKSVDTLLLNGGECEPYLTADHRIMLEKADEIIRGAEIIMKATLIPKCVIGIEDNKMDAISLLQSKIVNKPLFSVVPLKSIYPQGSEKHLIKSALGRTVPMRKLPLDVGVTVMNVSTVVAVADLFDRGMPLIERVLTVTGNVVREPKNLRVKIGTKVQELLDQCGGTFEEPSKVILGGPMMGVSLSATTVPITKGSSGIVAFDQKNAHIYEPINCIRCGRCGDYCPMLLEPSALHQACEAGLFEKADKYNVLDCIECGICSYVCPSRRNLVQAIRTAKYHMALNRARQMRRD